jgi:hypothetical protein
LGGASASTSTASNDMTQLQSSLFIRWTLFYVWAVV